MKQRAEVVLASLFFALAIGAALWVNAARPRILVLHSYDVDYGWCRDETVGLRRVLDAKRRYTIRWHYMDAKRHPSKEYLRGVGTQARRLVDEWRPDMIIAADDEAQEYVGRYYAGREGIAVVFLGINGEVRPYGYEGARNVTGIFERFSLDAVLDAVLAASGSNAAPRLLSLADMSEAAQADQVFINRFDWSPARLVESRGARTFDEWKRAVKSAETSADFVVAGNYRQIARSPSDPSLVPPTELVEWTETHSKVPVIGVKQAYAEEGGMLAVGASGYEQGEVAGRMAVQIMDEGKVPKDIAYAYPRMFLVSVREANLRARAIKLPSLYEAAARAAGKYYEVRHYR